MTEYKINSWHGVFHSGATSFLYWKVTDSILNYIIMSNWVTFICKAFFQNAFPFSKLYVQVFNSCVVFFTKKTVVQKKKRNNYLKVLEWNTTYGIVFPMFLTVLMLSYNVFLLDSVLTCKCLMLKWGMIYVYFILDNCSIMWARW